MHNETVWCPNALLIRVPIYCQPVYVAFKTDEWRRINVWHKWEVGNIGVGATGVRISDDGHSTFLIGVFDDRIDTLAHEVYHLTGYICDRANVWAAWDNDEAAAYLHGHLFSVIYELMMRNRRINKRLQNKACAVVRKA